MTRLTTTVMTTIFIALTTDNLMSDGCAGSMTTTMEYASGRYAFKWGCASAYVQLC